MILTSFSLLLEQNSFAFEINLRINEVLQGIKNGTVEVNKKYDYLAPDQSEIRLFPNLDGQGLAHCLLPISGVSKAMKHKTVNEIWEFVKGRGELWLKPEGDPEAQEKIIAVSPGVRVDVPVGAHFQFRNTDKEALEFLVVTEPVWPGPEDAVPVPGHWIDPLLKCELNEECAVEAFPERELMVYPILPTTARDGYKIEIFDVHQAITDHVHSVQTQYLLVLEGSAEFFNGVESVLLGPGGVATIPPGAVHHINPKGHVRFLGVDIPGFDFPERHTF